MDSSHVATGAITALLATTLLYLSHWPLQPLDLTTASAFAGLLVAAGGAAVKEARPSLGESKLSWGDTALQHISGPGYRFFC